LAQLQFGNSLVRSDEGRQRLRVQTAIDMRNQFERDVIDARVAGRGPAREPRKLAAISLGQMPPGHANLVFDDVEIVEEPFGRRRYLAILPDRAGDQLIRVDEDRLVFAKPFQKWYRSGEGLPFI